ncbi:MAG TPA: hypothetical protein VG432_17350 [Gemmatimonadaceae bacterium]|nr:hypothetical protein [Gemmatimonadaceae bacterium]
MRYRRCVLPAAAVIMSVGNVACRSSGRSSDLEPLDGMAESAGAVIPVEVQNDNMQDVNVYVVHGGLRSRVGIAGAASATTFVFPARYSAGAVTVQLLAVPLIGGRFGFRHSILSDPITVHAGQKILFNLESDLSRSTIGVYALDVLQPPDSSSGRGTTDSSTALAGRR